MAMHPVHLTPIYQASAERLFNAWTDPDLMRLWLFKSETNTIERIDRELSVGGRFSILEKADGELIDHYGQYTEIDAPHRLGFWLEVPAHFKGRTEVVISFVQVSQGCEMNFVQTGVDPLLVEKSWRLMFLNLAGTLLRTRAAGNRSDLDKLK
jgi:uncharacterized protein YndB with AHSA1/START domain